MGVECMSKLKKMVVEMNGLSKMLKNSMDSTNNLHGKKVSEW